MDRHEGKKVVEMKNIVKRFGNFTANDNINLTVYQGEIHAVLGENGAGKSTLMNILYGLYKPTDGQIFIDEKEKCFSSPNDAIKCGIGMVHQHFMLIQPYTVTENIILGDEVCKIGVLDMATAREKVIEISEKYKMAVDPDAVISDISVGMQQRVEILKALYRGADILILDEPTASLTPQEIDELIVIIKELARDNKSIIIITHKLKEIKAVADTCTIIRMGKYIDTVNVANTSEEDLAEMMVGRKVSFQVEKPNLKEGDCILQIENLIGKDYRGIEILKELSLSVKAGEILGIAGIDGNGQSELVEIITGLRKAESGNIKLKGKSIKNLTPREVFLSGVSCIPEDRQKHGLVLDFSVEDNMVLQNFRENTFQNKGILKKNSIHDFALSAIKDFDIRPNDCAKKPASTLSGGNQQKVIIAREVLNDKDLLIAVNPTRGLDVGAIEYVHKYIVEQRNKGKAVLLISFELDEILSLSDRIGVIYNGKIVGEFSANEVNERLLGLMMAGGTKHEK